jgi:hypothetical protein
LLWNPGYHKTNHVTQVPETIDPPAQLSECDDVRTLPLYQLWSKSLLCLITHTQFYSFWCLCIVVWLELKLIL